MNKVNIKRSRKRNWEEVEDVKFVQVWATKYAELRSPKKNLIVYADMVAELAILGVEVTVEEVRNKILNLTKKYRRQKQEYDPLYPLMWPLYNAVHDIIGAEPVNKKEVVASDNLESDPLKISTTTVQFSPVKCELASTPSILESPTVSPPPSPSPAPKTLHEPSSPAMAATSTSSDRPLEQAINTLLTMCTRFTENVEHHFLQSLVVEKQKLQELRAIRLATKKLSNGILELLNSTGNSNDK